MKLTRDDVNKVYAEVERRIRIMVADGDFDNWSEVDEYRKAMMQGVYGTLMVIADNWSEVRWMCDEEERR